MPSPARLSLWIFLLLSLVIVGCSDYHGQKADVVIPDAHGGGSALAIDPQSKLLASGGLDGTLRLTRLADGAPLAKWRGHSSSITGIYFFRDGQRLLTGGYDGMIDEWNLDGLLRREWDTGSPINHLVANEEADLVLTGHEDGSVQLWNLGTSALIKRWPVFPGGVNAVALDGAGHRVAATGPDGAVALWPIDGQPRSFERSENESNTLVFSPDGQSLYGAGWYRLYRWDLKSGRLQMIPTEHGGRINRITFMPNGHSLASISRQFDSAVIILDAASGQTERRFQKHELCGSVVTVSPDGHYLASTSDDASVRIWDLLRKPAEPDASQ